MQKRSRIHVKKRKGNKCKKMNENKSERRKGNYCVKKINEKIRVKEERKMNVKKRVKEERETRDYKSKGKV